MVDIKSPFYSTAINIVEIDIALNWIYWESRRHPPKKKMKEIEEELIRWKFNAEFFRNKVSVQKQEIQTGQRLKEESKAHTKAYNSF